MNIRSSSRSPGALQRLANASSRRLRLKLASKTNRWRLVLLVFIVVYASLLLFNLDYMALQWDEMPHLYGGLFLTRGQTQDYLKTYGYYPPLYDLITTGYYQLFGVSATSGRLAAVTFSLLSIWIVFELANRTYEPRTAMISSLLLGTMPGFFWISRVAMLETMLIFFFSLILFFFFTWLRTQKDKALILTGLAMGVGFLAKYQVLVAGLVMIAGILLLGRHKLKLRLFKFLLVPVIAGLVVAPWLMLLYQTDGAENFEDLLQTMSEGHEERPQYSARFFLPVFYLIEMTWPFTDAPVHPISLPIYVLGLLGLCLFAWRRKLEDKFFLAWFVLVYVFFTLIPNKQWRYITPIFPVLAISAACFILFAYDKAAAWKRQQINLTKKNVPKIATVLVVILAATAVIYSSYNAYQMVERDQIHLPIEEVMNYATSNMTENESIVLLCPFNLLNQDMLRFYLPANIWRYQVWQYPALPVDSFTPDFNITELIDLCEQHNVKWVVIYDHGAETPFFNTTLTINQVKTMMSDSGRFGKIADEPWYGFGTHPHRIFIFGFLHN